MRLIAERRLSLRVRMLGGTHTGYARLTRRWWTPVSAELAVEGLTERPLYFVSSNTHSLVNIVTGIAREREPELIAFVEQLPDDDILRQELTAFREGRSRGLVGELPVLRRAPVLQRPRRRRAAPSAAAPSSSRASPTCAARRRCGCPAQVIPLAALDPGALDPRRRRDRRRARWPRAAR